MNVRQIMGMDDKKKRMKQKLQGKLDNIELGDKEKSKVDDDDSDEDFILIDDSSDTFSSSRGLLYIKYTFQYSFSLILIVALLAIMTVSSYLNCMTLVQWGIRTDLSLRIRFVLWRLAYDSHMMAENDLTTYSDIGTLKSQLFTDLDLYNNIQLALLFGNPSLGLDQGRLPDVLRPAMFTRNYMYNTYANSMDSLS